MRKIGFILASIWTLCWGGILIAQEAGTPLTEQKIDERTTEIAETIRCMVCKNQSIAESDAELAKNMFNHVREGVEAGQTDDEIKASLVAGYGEGVLLQPVFSWKNGALWFGPIFLMGLAAWIAVRFISTRTNEAPPEGLNEEERDELNRLLS